VNCSILVVDDDLGLRALLRHMLELSGFQVVEAVDGVDVLEQMMVCQPDLMILDVMMPRMDGIAVCKTLRRARETADFPIIMLSGKTNRTAVQEGLAAGANKYLEKPMSFELLIQSIKELVSEVDHH
jgi:two-component system response regulator MprA